MKRRYEVWLNAYSQYGGDMLLGTYRTKFVANLRSIHALQWFGGYAYGTTIKPVKR